MNRHRLHLHMFCISLLLCCLLPALSARANGPVPSYFLNIEVVNPPAGAIGLDFLYPEDQIPEDEYTDCNTDALEAAGLRGDCELATWKDEDGYVSLLAHDLFSEYDGLLSCWDNDSHTYLDYDGGEVPEGAQLECYGYRSCYELLTDGYSAQTRIALFDRDGHVLSVSQPIDLRASTAWDFYGDIRFDAAEGIAVVELPEESGSSGGDSGFLGSILRTVGMLLAVGAVVVIVLLLTVGTTMLIEFLIALLFRLKPASWTLLVNFVSNLIFNILLIAFCFIKEPPLPYRLFIPAGEVIVVLAEYLIYCRIYKETSHGRLAAYSIAANLCSMLLVMAASAAWLS